MTPEEVETGSERSSQTQSSAHGSETAGATASETAASEAEHIAGELQDLRDKHLRLFAEFENFRKRAARENFEVIATANARLIGQLTEVLDNFQRAFDPKHRGAAEEFEKGVRLIYARLREILESEGLEELDPTGQEFDPGVHDALMQQVSDTVPENHVIQTVQKGYRLKAKILKHAKVIVSKGKET